METFKCVCFAYLILLLYYSEYGLASKFDKPTKYDEKTTMPLQINSFTGKDEAYLKNLLGIKGEDIEKNIARSRCARDPKFGYELKGKIIGSDQGAGDQKMIPVENKSEPVPPGLPTSFDWREHTECKSILSIRHQNCKDCWAVAAASVISDRYCLFTGKDVYFSAKALETCVYGSQEKKFWMKYVKCPPGQCKPCQGGWVQDAMEYYVRKGVSSGGDPEQNEPGGCLPYPKTMSEEMTCPTRCDDGSPLDLKYGYDFGTITSKNVTEIQRHIYAYGPVVAILEVFEDFFDLIGPKIYQHTSGKSLGWHAMRCIGWGEENGLPFWLCANMWGLDWGDKGFFKILRGSNHVGVETAISYVYPREAF